MSERERPRERGGSVCVREREGERADDCIRVAKNRVEEIDIQIGKICYKLASARSLNASLPGISRNRSI